MGWARRFRPDGNVRHLGPDVSGFTLVELLVVMAILGMLAVLTQPRWEAVVAGGETASPAKWVARALERARGEAVRRSRTTCVEADPATGALRLRWRRTGGDSTELLGDAGAPVRGAPPGSPVCFMPSGLATPARLSVGYGRTKWVEVEPWDGTITIHE